MSKIEIRGYSVPGSRGDRLLEVEHYDDLVAAQPKGMTATCATALVAVPDVKAFIGRLSVCVDGDKLEYFMRAVKEAFGE